MYQILSDSLKLIIDSVSLSVCGRMHPSCGVQIVDDVTSTMVGALVLRQGVAQGGYGGRMALRPRGGHSQRAPVASSSHVRAGAPARGGTAAAARTRHEGAPAEDPAWPRALPPSEAARRGGGRFRSRSRVRRSASSSSSRQQGPQSLYEVLGVPSSSTAKEIKAVYRKLAKANHPDVGGDPEKFKAIAKAYAVLSTPEARSEYDRQQRFQSYAKYDSGSSIEDTFDFFARKTQEEDFYGLGDLFRDIEAEFGGKDDDGIFRQLGNDLLDFLEGSAPKSAASAGSAGSAGGAGGAGGAGSAGGQQRGEKTKEGGGSGPSRSQPGSRAEAGRTGAGQGKGEGKGKSPRAKSSASFDAEAELEALKRQMGKM